MDESGFLLACAADTGQRENGQAKKSVREKRERKKETSLDLGVCFGKADPRAPPPPRDIFSSAMVWFPRLIIELN